MTDQQKKKAGLFGPAFFYYGLPCRAADRYLSAGFYSWLCSWRNFGDFASSSLKLSSVGIAFIPDCR